MPRCAAAAALCNTRRASWSFGSALGGRSTVRVVLRVLVHDRGHFDCLEFG